MSLCRFCDLGCTFHPLYPNQTLFLVPRVRTPLDQHHQKTLAKRRADYGNEDKSTQVQSSLLKIGTTCYNYGLKLATKELVNVVFLILKFKSGPASFIDFRDLRKKTEHKNVTVFFVFLKLNKLGLSN